ncbi:MAG: agmatinase [Bacillati bacterium ANGP1]|uniref:Agmatinase n=1 Tax=Candidatus Segetimicrobium genomatis TaxID=2569760 RepID=A0A537K0M8_9BACT|nr:MAG: agmatinase [Terrabacteria group bacterium ANGP1]
MSAPPPERFEPPNAFRSPRYAQLSTFMRLPYQKDPRGLDVAILGIPFDGGVSFRPGARFGPKEIRSNSLLIRPYHPVLRTSPFSRLRVADCGDVDPNPLDIVDTYGRIEAAVGEVLAAGAIPACVGGDHSISLAILRAVARSHGAVALVHFDSHQDMWEEYFGNRYFHGTPFRRALEEGLYQPKATVQFGIRGPVYGEKDFELGQAHGVTVVRAEEIHRHGVAAALSRLDAVRGRKVYVSFDIDSVDPAFAPGTGTPEVGGLSSAQTLDLLRGLAGLEIVAFDIVEVSPPYDQSGITAMLAANVLFELLSLISLGRP